MTDAELEDWILGIDGAGRFECPVCGPTRKKKNQKTLSVTVDGDYVLYNCWHCELSGKKKKKSYIPEPSKITAISKPKTVNKELISKFLSGRKIDLEKVGEFNIVSGTKYFNGGGELPAIGFCYGENEAIKWRSVEGKYFTQDDADRSLWTRAELGKACYSTIIITEGEMDALAITQALASSGEPERDVLVCSVPNGAPSKFSNKRIDASEDKKFAYIWTAKSLIEEAERVILAADDDEAGEALLEEVSRRIGRAKCWKIEYPEGCKDANDVLIQHGEEELAGLIDNPVPMPLEGVYSANDYSDDVQFLYDKGLMGGISTGYKGVDDIYTVLQGQLTVVTGLPGSGKSQFIDNVMVNLPKNNDWKWAVASFENPPALHIVKLSECYTGKPFFDGVNPRMDQKDLAQAKDFVNNHFAFLDSRDGDPTTIDSIIDRAKQAVMRLGVRGLVVDPYNYIAQSGGDNEHHSISEMLTRMVQFARSHDLAIFFIAHPAKMRQNDNGTYPIPKGMHISGSAAWFAKADNGLTVHREEGHVEIHSWKARFKWIGTVGSCNLTFDPVSGRYEDEREDQWEIDTPKEVKRDFHETDKEWDF